MKPKIVFLFAEQTFGSQMFVCTLTLPGQNPDADLSENRTGSVCKTSLLRPAGGVKHSDSDLVETGMLSAKKALRWIEGSIFSNSRKF